MNVEAVLHFCTSDSLDLSLKSFFENLISWHTSAFFFHFSVHYNFNSILFICDSL
jgi:hypothetical protein